MEIVELIIGLSEGCMCFLEFATLFSNGTAAYSGYKTFKTQKADPQLKKPSIWPFVFVITVAIGFTVLCVIKYTR